MKKMMALLAAFVILSAGCSSQQVKDEIQEEVRDMQEDITEVVPGEDAAPVEGGGADDAQLITEEQAKEIALNQAGLTADEVVFEVVKLEKDDGIWEYEVDFRKDRIEYDAKISATDGTIIAWEVDND